MHGLQKSAGYLQKRVSNRIDARYTPRLQFVLDEGIKNATKVSEILNDVLPENEAPANEDSELIDESTTPQDEQPDNAS